MEGPRSRRSLEFRPSAALRVGRILLTLIYDIPLFDRADTPSDAEAHAHLLGFLIGLDYRESRHLKPIRDDQKQIRNRAFFAAAQMFRRIAAEQHLPIVMQLDDLQWADDPSLDFLAYLSQVGKDVPLLIIGVMRDTLFERREVWIGAAPHRRIDLRPLGKGVSRELANELLKKLPEVPSALRDLVSGGADGNPFYMEELVKMLIDRGAISVGAQWTLHPDKLVATQVPATLTGVLQARLDGLPPAERCRKPRLSAWCSGTKRSPPLMPPRLRCWRIWRGANWRCPSRMPA